MKNFSFAHRKGWGNLLSQSIIKHNRNCFFRLNFKEPFGRVWINLHETTTAFSRALHPFGRLKQKQTTLLTAHYHGREMPFREHRKGRPCLSPQSCRFSKAQNRARNRK